MDRRDPDALLDRLQREAQRSQRGRLKIFFGACAGVGKTFAMLQAARRLHAQGDEVLAGVIETHGRQDTAGLLDGLERLPPALLPHRGRALAEFDLDAALARHAKLVLVDELAHANVPGARHRKRWQDVEDLLAEGIDVWTTLNVQHLESLNDIVGQITGVQVRETVPDHVFDMADEVTLVDLPAEELLQRLREGKVYVPDQAQAAARHFFRKGNLIALRELALRRTAERVDAQMREYRSNRSIQRIWPAGTRLMACVGPGAAGERVVRATARLAASLRIDWIAVHVQTARLDKQPLDALKLAGALGADTAVLDGSDAADALLNHARLHNVTMLVIGAPGALRRLRLRRGTGARLSDAAAPADITLVHAPAGHAAPRMPARPASGPRPLRPYAEAGAVALGVTGLANLLSPPLGLANVIMLYLLGVVFAAVRLGRGPGILLSVLSVAAFDWVFVPPRLSLSVSDTQYLLTFAVMLLTSLTISHLTSSLRRQARVATLREQRTRALYAIARELGAALSATQIVETGARHVADVFQARVAILLPDADEQVHALPTGLPADRRIDAPVLDRDIAQWVYAQQKAAGRGSDTLPAAAALYLPLRAPMRTRGTLALITARSDELASPEQQRLLDTFAAQIALAIERAHYVDVAQDAVLSMESERLRSSLLSAVSHDLRTPLTSIVGFASMLAERGGVDAANRPVVDAIHEEALRMTSLVSNLLDMARLQEGRVQLNRQWMPLEEPVGAALHACRVVLAGRAVDLALDADLPPLCLDAVLFERLFVNLLENAAKYTPPGSALRIAARVAGEGERPQVEVVLDDRGPGLPAGKAAALFDKFARGEPESAAPGIGLGLAICRAIVEAHGGRIDASNRLDRDGQVSGARLRFVLPVETPPMAHALPLEDAQLPHEIARSDHDAASVRPADSGRDGAPRP